MPENSYIFADPSEGCSKVSVAVGWLEFFRDLCVTRLIVESVGFGCIIVAPGTCSECPRGSVIRTILL